MLVCDLILGCARGLLPCPGLGVIICLVRTRSRKLGLVLGR